MKADQLPSPEATSLSTDEVNALREWAAHTERTLPEHVVLLCDEVLRLRRELAALKEG
jgi:hypothetical protein